MLELADAFLPGYIPPVVGMYHLGVISTAA